MLGQSDTIKEYQTRFPVLYYCILLVFGLLFTRLFYLQIYRGNTFRKISENNSLRKDKLPGPRGLIFDRNGVLLVDNRLQLDATVTPQFTRNPRELTQRLAALSGESAEKLYEKYIERSAMNPRFQPVTLLENLSWPLVVKIESLKAELAGVEVNQSIRRTYLKKQVGAHLFGYISEVTKKELQDPKLANDYEIGDWIGRYGLERKWESYLKGNDGVRFVVVNAHGHRISQNAIDPGGVANFLQKDILPKPGHNLVLTLDSDLQDTAAEQMKGRIGAVVAMDARTGEVLAMHSLPGFDPTEMTTKAPELWKSFVKSSYGPLRNKTIQDHFPAGSTFKVFTALAALEQGIVTPQTSYFCPGFFRFGKRLYNCHLKAGHGQVSLMEAIRGSCDVYFYNIAARMGIDAISKMGSLFGLGKRTGIDLFNEAPGLMPTENWKQQTYKEVWQAGETLSASIGQGYNLVTPIQLAQAYSTLVNGGNLYRPYVVSRIETMDGTPVKSFSPELLSSAKVNPKFIDDIKEALLAVVNSPSGTAFRYAHSKEIEIGGKSGTAQVISLSRDDLFKPCTNLPFEKRHHAWFVGYAPKKDPEIVVAVLGMHECGGGRSSGPVVKAIIEKWWEKKKAREALKGPQPASI